MSAGKTALPSSGNRQCQGKRGIVRLERIEEATPAAVSDPITVTAEPVPAETQAPDTGSCRDQARARRALLSKRGRGDAPPAPPSRPLRGLTLEHAPQTSEPEFRASEPEFRDSQRVTGVNKNGEAAVTGQERGAGMLISGTHEGGHVGAWRNGAIKVGHARTPAGLIVSGTLVRSKVGITGDEFGGAIITGEADQRIEDDLTSRPNDVPTPQFQRRIDPHGQTVFGTNLGRSGRRSRERRGALEATEIGLPVTGSAIGRSARVTGDEDGACRAVTGDQYFTPAANRAECGAPASLLAARLDPVTGAKVSIAQTLGGQKITGADVERNPLVTGGARGSQSAITGNQYQGRQGSRGETQEVDYVDCRPAAPVTGDAPVHDATVTGTARGAARDITGTPYYRDDCYDDAAAAEDPVARIDGCFSVASPQRRSHLHSRANGARLNGCARSVTGSFAVGQDKITGNTEFTFRPRGIANGDGRPAHAKLTGEGRSEGRRITGDSWSEHPGVTGAEGVAAAARNPSERAGEPRSFAGSGKFKALAKREDPKELVTGMFYFSKTGAKVTLSGGAQG